jgi:aldose 1-epimerase
MVDMTPKIESTALELHAGDLTAVFLPELGMLGASLQHQGEELLGRVDDVPAFARAARTCGIPLLHPWANRLAGDSYRVDGREVRIDETSPLLHRDPNGLLMHGVPWAHLAWEPLVEHPTGVTARLEWTSPDLLDVFPFPHRVEMTVALDAGGLTLDATLHAGSGVAVPVSFGFHPYLRLPGLPRERWRVTLPTMMHLLVDEATIPTGDAVGFPALDAPLGQRDFDDGFALLQPHGVFAIAGGSRRITVDLIEGFDYFQVYAPVDEDYIALEPMTAPANALLSGEGLRVVAPGESHHTRFRIAVEAIH